LTLIFATRGGDAIGAGVALAGPGRKDGPLRGDEGKPARSARERRRVMNLYTIRREKT